MTETTMLHIPAIHCDGCIESIKRIVERKGAQLAAGDPETKDVTIRFDPTDVSERDLVTALADADFEPREG